MDFENEEEMIVTKRNGTQETVSFDKILARIKRIGTEANIKINYTTLVMKVIDQLYSGISTTKIDELSAEQCASMASIHPDYNILAGHITVSNHHKNTKSSFLEVMKDLYNYTDKHDKHSPLVTKDIIDSATKYEKEFNELIDYNRDYLIEYFGFKTLERAYLMKINKVTVERPQHMWMRVSIGIHGMNFEKIVETYNLMSQKYFTHATPTLFNAGTPHPQLSSCYLLGMEDDSISGIYNTLKDCALISKWAGGIGVHIHNVRAAGSHIRGTNGSSNGIVPMLKVFNNTAKYVDQCVLPETYIYTTEGPMQIQDCMVGKTAIINKNGDAETIKDVLEHTYEGTMLTIKSLHSLFPLSITPLHPVYAIQDQAKGTNYNVIKNRLEKKLIQPDWIEAKDLDENSMIGYSIPNYKQDVQSIDESDCYMYGVILGDGYVNNKTDGTGYLSLHSSQKKHILDYAKSYFENKCVDYHITTFENTTRIRWNKSVHLPFRHQDTYDNNKEKRISYKWLNLPLYKIKQIMKGLLHTDGCISKEIVFDSTSIQLIEGLRYMCLRMGILTSGYIRDRIGEKHISIHGDVIENKRINYVLRIPKVKAICELLEIDYDEKQFFKYMQYGNMLFTRVQEIEETEYNGILYDLQMEKEHNYMIHNGVIHNGGGKRNGSFAIYLEPWHADVELFLQMRKNHGDEELKARDLFYALWVPDLFMKRMKSDGDWTLMCPDECPGLSDVYGEEFETLYEKYESAGKGRKTMKARDLWFQILDAQMETGTPYLVYKDAANKKSNQKNIGTIKSSNLCSEIIEYSDENESAVCNLASIAAPAFVETNGDVKEFNYKKLHEVAKVVTNNLNAIIDVNFYPTDKTKRSNLRHRPIGIGIQGLADVFIMMGLSFGCEESKKINKLIFETIYHAALESSNEIAIKRYEIVKEKRYDQTVLNTTVYNLFNDFEKNKYTDMDQRKTIVGSYSTFEGSPASFGELQFDMWNVTPSDMYDWNKLKDSIKMYGLRNSLLLAPMPTASTSQILGYNECIEPITSNIYNRRTIAGEFILANKYLMKDLIDLDMWNEKIKNNIIANNGSIQQIDFIPHEIKEKYKTVWEIPMRTLIDMAADRGAYICQSQSLNLWLEEPNYSSLTSMHFYSWSKGLKTGIYYLRRRARHQAQQFTIEPEKKEQNNLENVEELSETLCEMCSA